MIILLVLLVIVFLKNRLEKEALKRVFAKIRGQIFCNFKDDIL